MNSKGRTPSTMDSKVAPSVGPSAANIHRRTTPIITQRKHISVLGCTYKAKWHPYQTRIRVAKHLNDCLLPRLDKIVKFKDPAGNSHNIAGKIHNDRQWFEDGILQMMQFYKLHETVQIHHTYTLHDYIALKIWRTNDLGEIPYPQRQQVQVDIKDEPTKVINIEDDINIKDEPQEDINNEEELLQFPTGSTQVLWTTKLTKAQEGGRQGLVLPVTIVTEFLSKDQEVLNIYVPNRGLQPWKLLWNTKIPKYCRLAQGWYQYCREKRLKEGDELCFWKVDGTQFISFQLRRPRD
ncbi:DNA-binding barrel domain superfamily [Sesbania bispinosa]|nr:DNA-binding barrel domain superfamily [Sesbania bispinosa]